MSRMKIVRKKLFFLSSADRQATESINNFSIAFPENLMRTQPNELLRITMTYFSLINSFQNINSNNNRIGVALVQSGVTYTGFITLPVGSYSVYQIATNMTTALNSLFSAYTTFTVSVPDSTTYYGKWTWTTAITSLTLYFQNSALPTSLFTQQQIAFPMYNGASRILGWLHETTSVTITTSGFTTPLNMFSGQISYLRLHVDTPPVNVEFASDGANNQLNYSDILAQVAILVPPYSPIVYQEFAGDNNSFEMPAKNMKLGTLNFTLTDNYNTPVILQDDWDFVLKIEVLADEENDSLLKSIHDTLKLQTLNMHDYFSK